MNTVVDEFRRVFLGFGYLEEKEAPIYPCPDQTTLFTCATISTLKRDLLSGAMAMKFSVQPCLRTQNIKRILDDSFDPEYLSNFLMVGMLCPVGSFNPECIVSFFDSFPDLKGKILVRSSGMINEEILSLVGNYEIEYDTRVPDYYHWQYGESFLSGKGVTFALKQLDGNFLDVGNLLLIYVHGIPVAMEFGFGQETFIARQLSLGSPYVASEAYMDLDLGMSPWEKRLGDSIITALRLVENGVRPGKGKASSVLRKALRNACLLAVQKVGQSASVRILDIAERASHDSQWLDVVRHAFMDVSTALDAFYRAVEHIKNHASGPRLEIKIAEYRSRYAIPDEFHY